MTSSSLHARSAAKIKIDLQDSFSDDQTCSSAATTKLLSPTLFLDEQIVDVLQGLNKFFSNFEATNPQQGYCVTIETTPALRGKLVPYGGARTTELLSGIAENELDYIKKCPFCLYAKNNFTDARIVQKFDDASYAVTSLNNQVLVIPVEHYSHLFITPFETQVAILKNILLIRTQYADNIQRPIEFHCGSAAGQTVFHLHGRTGVYIKNELN